MLIFSIMVFRIFSMLICSFMATGTIRKIDNAFLYMLFSYFAFAVFVAIITGINGIVICSMTRIAFYVVISI